MKRLFFTSFFLVIGIHCWAQFSIKGSVVNASDNTPLSGARISLMGTFFQTSSNDNGSFFLRNIKPGKYSLVTTFLGFEADTTEFTVKENTDIRIKLQTKVILAEEVEIQSTRAGSKTPFSSQDISIQRIQSQNLGQDLPFLLSNSISATLTSDAGNGVGYTALRIRGTDMTRINVTINGIPLNDPESHNVFWVDLPDFAASTDNIQIQRGIGTSTNGAAAFGASINLQSDKIQNTAYAYLSSSAGSFKTMKNSIAFGSGLIDNHWSVNGRISRLVSDGYIDRASSSLNSYFLSTAYSDSRNILRFNLFTGKEKTYQAWDGIPHEILDTNRTYNGMGAYTDLKGNQKFYPNETDNYEQTHFQALFSHQLNQFLYVNLAAHYTKGAGFYEQYRDDDELANYGISPVRLPGPYYILNQDTILVPDSLIASSDLIRRKWLDNDFAGITYSLNWNKRKFQATFGGSLNSYTGHHFGKVIWAQFAGNSELDQEWYRSKATKTDLNIYLKSNYEISPLFNIMADMQVRNIIYSIDGIDDDSRNISQDHTFTFYNPKVGIFATLNEFNSAFLSYAVAKREPNRDNFVDADPVKPSPKPETLYDLEAGYKFNKRILAISTNLYYMYYQDQLALTGAINDVGNAVMENVPKSYRLGIEINSQMLLYKSLHWNFNATLSRNKIKSYIEYVDNFDTWEQISIEHSKTDLAFSPGLIASNELSWDFIKNGSIQLISKYTGKQYIDNTMDENRKLRPYLIHNVQLSYTIHPPIFKAIEFSLQINNFLNKKYESNAWVYRYYFEGSYHVADGYFPQAQLNLMAGIRVKL